MQRPSNGRHPLSCRARCPSARLRQCRWSLADVSVYGVPRPSAVSRMLGLNEANVNIFSWTPPAPGSDKLDYVNKTGGYCWRIYFKVLEVPFLASVSRAFLPSKQT